MTKRSKPATVLSTDEIAVTILDASIITSALTTAANHHSQLILTGRSASTLLDRQAISNYNSAYARVVAAMRKNCT